MALGPGSYDDLALALITRLNANAIFVEVVDGIFGDGASVKVLASSPQEAAKMQRDLARRLRERADECEQDADQLEQGGPSS